MKKILSVLLVLLLAFACVTAASADDMTGVWSLTGVKVGLFTVDPGTFGVSMSITLKADGTFVLDQGGDSELMEGTWTMEGNTLYFTSEGETLSLNYDGSCLSGWVQGWQITVHKTGPAADPLPARIDAQDISAFNGSWIPSRIGVNGVYMDFSALSALGIDEDKLRGVSFSIDNGLITPVGEGATAGDALQFELNGGELTAVSGGETYRICLFDDGTLELGSPSLNFTLLLVRA